MTTSQLLLSGWDWEPSIIAGCVALVLAHARAVHFHFSRAALYYISGVLLIAIALMSPIDLLGDTYLFSAHMLQHLMLALMIPLLLLNGIPPELASRAVSVPLVGRIELVLRKPAVAWMSGIGAMALWHVPALFNASLAHEGLHIAQHLCFLVTGTIFWWPIASPLQKSRLSPIPWAAMYLFVACLACTVIGILLTFSPAALYPAYLAPTDELGLLPLIQGQWGFTPDTDHQVGGLLMWVLGCTIYASATMVMFARWFAAKDDDRAQEAA